MSYSWAKAYTTNKEGILPSSTAYFNLLPYAHAPSGFLSCDQALTDTELGGQVNGRILLVALNRQKALGNSSQAVQLAIFHIETL